MFENYKALLGPAAETRYSANAAFGDFNVRRNVKVSVTDGHSTAGRQYDANEAYTALGLVHAEVSGVLHDPRGMNTQIIGESGDVERTLVVEALSAKAGVARNAIMKMQADSHLFVRNDSQVQLLFSLLSTAYTLGAKESAYSPVVRTYDDGHIKAALSQMLPNVDEGRSWKGTEAVTIQAWDQTSFETEAPAPVLWFNRMSKKEASIVKAHFGGRNRTTKFAADVDLPRLAPRVLLSGAGGSVENDLNEADVKSADIIGAINKYVETNRLYGAFEQALAILHQVALSPVPDTAEGLAWLKRKRTVVLPEFDAWRGAYTASLTGKAYGLDSAVTTTWKWWYECGLTTVVPGALYNAVSLWGRYFVEAKFFHDDAAVHSVANLEFGENPGAAYYAYAALVTGHETYVAIPGAYGIKYGSWEDDTEVEIEIAAEAAGTSGYNIVTRGGVTKLVVGHVPTPASQVHIIGRMPSDGVFSNLADSYTVKFERTTGGWVFPNVKSAWGFGMATRWLGYNSHMSYKGEDRLANWAPNQSSIASRPFNQEGKDNQSVFLSRVEPRAKVFDYLPSMVNEENEWRVQVDVAPQILLHAGKPGQFAVTGVFKPPRGQKTPGVVMPAPETLIFAAYRIKRAENTDFKNAGFQVVQQDTLHHPPEPDIERSGELPVDEESGGQGQPDAE